MSSVHSRIWLLGVLSLLLFSQPHATAARVHTIKLAAPGFRPQAMVDSQGTLHVVYAHLEPRGNLFYVRKGPKENQFSKPIRVNSTPGCTAAFNMAVGKGGRVHVLIRPNAKYSKDILKRRLKFIDLKYMLYCRLNDKGTAFEKARDISGDTFGFEGVGAVIADAKGGVSIFWHGLAEKGREPSRQIFRIHSRDEGKTFSAIRPIQKDVIGACACCSMQGAIGADGKLYLAYRNSEKNGNKDSYLLTSSDGGKSFRATLLDRWAEAGCPGSTYALWPGPDGTLVTWNTLKKVYFAEVGQAKKTTKVQTKANATRSPVVASNSKGEVIFVWAEAASIRHFFQGGDLAWQVYDKRGRPTAERGKVKGGVARWSVPAVYVQPNGDFVILHDGPIPKQ